MSLPEGWEPDVAGVYKHWKQTDEFFGGLACMHIWGDDGDTPWYVGVIQFASEYHDDNVNAFKTKVCDTIEECISLLDAWWEDLISMEFGTFNE